MGCAADAVEQAWAAIHTEGTLTIDSALLVGNRRITIQLSSSTTVAPFTNKLASINAIYEELAGLANVSTTEYPLRIVKIESGSLLIDVLGYPRIIEIIKTWIEQVVACFWRNFTTEGKIESILDARNKLSEAGIQTVDADGALEKALFGIAHGYNRLLIGEATVMVDGETHSIGEQYRERYLEEARILSLPSGEADDEGPGSVDDSE
ncbi:MAG: hypothetical protein CL694_01240 [Chloroflexi bacterium]|nr:hypothetical protein [Chloroflexota bacterium]MQG58042.1 hypothetical protein [SAR202 cluster bacterium]